MENRKAKFGLVFLLQSLSIENEESFWPRNEVCSLLQKCKQKRRTRREQKESKREITFSNIFLIFYESH